MLQARLGRFAAGLAAAALLLGAPAAPPVSAQEIAERAIPAQTLVDSVGVNVHFSFATYNRNFERVRSLLLGAGIRHLREGALHDDRILADLERLGRDGIRADYVFRPTDTAAFISGFPARVPDSFESFEDPNELDRSGDPGWDEKLRAFDALLARTVRSDPRLSRYPIVGPSLTSDVAFGRLGDSVAELDFGNMHDYPGGHEPENKGYGHNGYGSIRANIDAVRLSAGAKPLYATETGYCARNASGGTPDSVTAIYEPRIFLAHLGSGVARTYQYEFLNEDDEKEGIFSQCGIVHADLTPKPAYYALKNLLGTFADPGPRFTPGTLRVGYGGDLVGLRHELFQKRDGTMLLALWRDRSIFDTNTRVLKRSAPQPVELALGAEARGASARRFTDGGALVATPVERIAGGLEVGVDERVTIVTFPAR